MWHVHHEKLLIALAVTTVIESFVVARDRFMKKATLGKLDIAPGCNMYPSTSNIYLAPFCDEALYAEQYNKTLFFSQVCASILIMLRTYCQLRLPSVLAEHFFCRFPLRALTERF